MSNSCFFVCLLVFSSFPSEEGREGRHLDLGHLQVSAACDLWTPERVPEQTQTGWRSGRKSECLKYLILKKQHEHHCLIHTHTGNWISESSIGFYAKARSKWKLWCWRSGRFMFDINILTKLLMFQERNALWLINSGSLPMNSRGWQGGRALRTGRSASDVKARPWENWYRFVRKGVFISERTCNVTVWH